MAKSGADSEKFSEGFATGSACFHFIHDEARKSTNVKSINVEAC